MKTFIEVTDVTHACRHARAMLPVITRENLLEFYTSLVDSVCEVSFFIAPGAMLPSFYKLVEEYNGSMTVYCSDPGDDPVFLSRFTSVQSLRTRTKGALQTPQVEQDIKELKSYTRTTFS